MSLRRTTTVPVLFQLDSVGALDTNDSATPARATFGVSSAARLAFQVVQKTGSWTTAVLTVKRSFDGVTWLAMGTPLTITAVGIVDGFDVVDAQAITVEVTTAEGSAATVEVFAAMSSIEV